METVERNETVENQKSISITYLSNSNINQATTSTNNQEAEIYARTNIKCRMG